MIDERHARTLLRIASAAGALLVLSAPLSADTRVIADWVEGRLTVVAREVPCRPLVRDVARRVEIVIRGLDSVSGTCSVEFTRQPLLEGLRLLLAEFNYVMVVRKAGHGPPAAAIWIHSHASPEPSSAAAAAATTDTGSDDRWRDAEQELRRLEIARFFDEADVGALLQAVRTASAPVQVRALNMLRQRDPGMAAGAAALALRDPHPGVSGAATQLLAELDHKAVVESLGAALRDSDPAVRSVALELLALRAEPESLPYVRPLLEDESPAIRKRAEALVKSLHASRGRTSP